MTSPPFFESNLFLYLFNNGAVSFFSSVNTLASTSKAFKAFISSCNFGDIFLPLSSRSFFIFSNLSISFLFSGLSAPFLYLIKRSLILAS